MTHFIRNRLDTHLWVPSSIKEVSKDENGVPVPAFGIKKPTMGLLEPGEEVEVEDGDAATNFAKHAGDRVEHTEQ